MNGIIIIIIIIINFLKFNFRVLTFNVLQIISTFEINYNSVVYYRINYGSL